MQSNQISILISTALIGYGIISGIFTISFFLVSQVNGCSLFIGYEAANRSEAGNCAALALLAQHSLISTTLYVTGLIIAYRLVEKLIRLYLIAVGIGLAALSYYTFIGAYFCSGYLFTNKRQPKTTVSLDSQ